MVKNHGHVVPKNSSGHFFSLTASTDWHRISAKNVRRSEDVRDTGTRVIFKKSKSNPAVFWCRTNAWSSAFAEWDATGLEC